MTPDAALERFCADAFPQLVGLLAHECGDVHLAEEFAQEALTRACERWEQVSAMDAPVGWCFRVGANLSRSWFRRRAVARRARTHAHDVEARPDVDVASQIVVRDALRRLTSAQRDAVLLRYALDLSVEQTAALLGTTEGAVRGLTHRALRALREELSADFPTIPEEVSDGA
ncbi:MAG: sigma-70 family RNA polymerase sigma factor [Nitriliruptorales bacterium]